MIEVILVVLTNPVPSRDDDFNDWYTNVHTRDAMRFRGSIGQQRFVLAADRVQKHPARFPTRYLALYEVFDAELFSREHIDNAMTSRMMVEDSIEICHIDDFHYYPLHFHDKAPRTFSGGGVVLEQIASRPGHESAFRDWYNDHYLSERFAAGGMISASFLAYDPYGQFIQHAHRHDHMGIFRLADDGARDAWRASRALRDCPYIDQDKLIVTCWDVLTARVTEDDVRHTTAKVLAAEEAACASPQPVLA